MVPETTCGLPAHRRDQLVDALCVIVTGLAAEERPAGAPTPVLDLAVARWSNDVPAPADVLGLVAQVRARTREDRTRRHAELLHRAQVVGVAAVAARHVREALTDPLTGLATRARLEEEAQHLVAGCTRAGAPLTAVLLDVDGLKRINDEQGHVAGDAAIAEAGHAIRAHLRGGDRGFRYGGDEFVLFLPGTTAEGARVLVDRIRERCSTPMSAGFATHSGDPHDTDVARWLTFADTELYDTRREERAAPGAVPHARRPRAAWLLTAAAGVVAAGGVGLLVPAAVHLLVGHPRPAVRSGPEAPVDPASSTAPARTGARVVRTTPAAASPAPGPVRTVTTVVRVPSLPKVPPLPAVRMPDGAPTVLPTLPAVPVLPTAPPSPSPSPGLVGGVVQTVGNVIGALL